MISKDEAKKAGFQVKESSNTAQEEKERKINQLKTLVPSLLNSDNIVDTNAIKDFIGGKNTTSNNKGYELTFAGKGLARAMADIKTTKELKLEPTQSKNPDKTENVIIRGDNLDVLKILNKNYSDKIKMIYIDPPYNTSGDGFLYKNNFKQSTEQLIEHLELEKETMDYLNGMYGTKTHSGWLAFMYPRLKLARDLLTDDGFLAITIDHYELSNLICITDEIFGEENKLGIITILHNPKGRNLANFISENSEFMLIFCKNKNNASFQRKAISEDVRETFTEEDEKGKYRWDGFMRVRKDSTRKNKPNFFYPLYVSRDLKEITLESKKGYYKVLPLNNKREEYSWKTLPQTFEERNINKDYKAEVDDSKVVILNKYREKEIIKNVWIDAKYHSEFNGTKIVKDLLGDNVFSFPKSLYAVTDILKLTTEEDDLILDFFAGSGTTAHAVMELNKKDGGNRKFILVQWDEEIDPEKSQPAYDFCKENNLEPVISSICIERVNRAGKEIKKNKSLLDKEVDIGYKVFSLTDRPALETGKDGQLQLNINHATTKDTLYNMMAASGETLLSQPIEQIEEDRLYKVGDAYFVLSKCETDLTQFSSNHIYIDGYAAGVNPGKQWSPELTKALQLIDKRGGALGALCTGAYQLAKSDLLNGIRCTLHWENIVSTREEFPQVVVTNDIYEIDKGRYTCAGGTTSIDLMLELVSRSQGRELAAAISEEAVIDRIRTKDDQQRIPLRQQIGTSQPKLTEAVKLMEANLEELISPDELASYVGISRRQLERLFRTYLDCTPSRYYLELRLRNARMLLLQTENSIVEISLVCGFVSTPHFSKCYREMFGLPPRDERRRLLVGALPPVDSAGN